MKELLIISTLAASLREVVTALQRLVTGSEHPGQSSSATKTNYEQLDNR